MSDPVLAPVPLAAPLQSSGSALDVLWVPLPWLPTFRCLSYLLYFLTIIVLQPAPRISNSHSWHLWRFLILFSERVRVWVSCSLASPPVLKQLIEHISVVRKSSEDENTLYRCAGRVCDSLLSWLCTCGFRAVCLCFCVTECVCACFVSLCVCLCVRVGVCLCLCLCVCLCACVCLSLSQLPLHGLRGAVSAQPRHHARPH